MKHLRISFHFVVAAIIVLAFSMVASAQATRTWVSGVGDDANPCSRTAPCKTFAGAISKTAPSGEIDCLDPGGFGALTITKSITIDCDAGPGGVLVSGTNGIVINANASTDTITLRSLNLQGIGTGLSGVQILSAKTVHLVDMNIYGFTQNGVNVATSAGLFLTIEDTRIHECANGIQINASAGLVTANVNRVSIWNSSGNGIGALNGSRLQVNSSTIFGNNVGINQTGLTANGSQVMVSNSTLSNGTALQSAAGGSIGVSGSVLSFNGTVFNPSGGSISTAGDNIPLGNGAIGFANGPAITKI